MRRELEWNKKKAIELYHKAAEQGYIKAQNKIYFFKYNDSSKLKERVQELAELYHVKKDQY